MDGLSGANSVTVSADGQYVYAAALAPGALSVFKKRGDSLVYVHCLKNREVVLLGAFSVTVSADGQYVYVAAPGDDALSVFKKSGDSLAYVTCLIDGQNGVDGLNGASSVTVSADGQYVYVAAYGDNAVSWFRVVDEPSIFENIAQKMNTTRLAVVPYKTGGVLQFAVTVPVNEKFTLHVYNAAGRRVWSQRGQGTRAVQRISVATGKTLAAGFYAVRLETDKVRVNEKFLFLK